MERRFFLKLLAASIAATNIYKIPNLHAQTMGGQTLALSLKLNLSGPGRIGFYIDYSELDVVGTHTFYVTRTHGSEGNVGCIWTAYDSADGSQLETGSLSWQDNSLDILSFNIDVLSKPDGDHRIYVLLSNPTGGAVLHHGENTVAYGIIDDGTIATSNSIFIDADAAAGGTGTQESPYNNWYSARDAVLVDTRFIYLKGMLVPDGTDNVAMSRSVKHFALKNTFEGRENEAQRLVIRSWPGFNGGLDGGNQTDCAGFVCDGGASDTGTVKYITFRKLLATSLSNADGGTSGGKCYFLRTRSGSGDFVENFTAEHITVNGIVSGANAAVAVWYSEDCSHFKLWRWSVANTSHIAREYNLNTFECYRTDNVSIQRCTIEQTAGGFYQKEGFSGATKTAMSLRFNHLKGCHMRFSTQGGKSAQDFTIVQNNIFDEVKRTHDFTPLMFDMNSTVSQTTKHQVSNNIFYNYDYSAYADINVSSSGYGGLILFNNIHSKSKRPWRFDPDVSQAEYIDYNHYEGNSSAPIFDYRGAWGLKLEAVRDQFTFDTNATVGAPEFDDISWILSPTSPCYQSGVEGTNKGLFLLGTEEIGSSNSNTYAPPEKMSSPDITILG